MTDLVRNLLKLAFLCAAIATAAHVAPRHLPLTEEGHRALFALKCLTGGLAGFLGIWVIADRKYLSKDANRPWFER